MIKMKETHSKLSNVEEQNKQAEELSMELGGMELMLQRSPCFVIFDLVTN